MGLAKPSSQSRAPIPEAMQEGLRQYRLPEMSRDLGNHRLSDGLDHLLAPPVE
jgi:hypothetical protein